MSAWRCPGCGYLYDEERDPREGFRRGRLEVPDHGPVPIAESGTRSTSSLPMSNAPAAPTQAPSPAAERAPYAVAARRGCGSAPVLFFQAARDELQRGAWSEIMMAHVAGAAASAGRPSTTSSAAATSSRRHRPPGGGRVTRRGRGKRHRRTEYDPVVQVAFEDAAAYAAWAGKELPSRGRSRETPPAADLRAPSSPGATV